MRDNRVIPCLLIQGNKLVKTINFKDPVYIGDPVNAVRIFSEKEVDELIILDIDATVKKREPNYELIAEIAGECFMPVTYGGGVKNIDQATKLIRSGIEKIVINSASYTSMRFISEMVETFGAQAIVGALDVKKKLFGGYRLMSHSGACDVDVGMSQHISNLVNAGVGEIFINSIDRDGKMAGYDLELVKDIVSAVDVPVVVCGGAGNIEHLKEAINSGASAVAAGSLFVYHGKHKAVLINYPKKSWL